MEAKLASGERHYKSGLSVGDKVDSLCTADTAHSSLTTTTSVSDRNVDGRLKDETFDELDGLKTVTGARSDASGAFYTPPLAAVESTGDNIIGTSLIQFDLTHENALPSNGETSHPSHASSSSDREDSVECCNSYSSMKGQHAITNEQDAPTLKSESIEVTPLGNLLPSFASFSAATKGLTTWFSSAGKNVTEKSQQFVETIGPDLKDFASQITEDTASFIQSHTLFNNQKEAEGKLASNTSSGREVAPESIQLPQAPSAHGSLHSCSKAKSDSSRASTRTTSPKTGASFPVEGRVGTNSFIPQPFVNMSSHFIARYMKMRTDPKSFLIDPRGNSQSVPSTTESPSVPSSTFVQSENQWKLIYVQDDPLLSRLLLDLVPTKIPAETFWERFFARVDQLKEEELQLASLLQTAANLDADDDLAWDDTIEDDNEEVAVVTHHASGSKDSD